MLLSDLPEDIGKEVHFLTAESSVENAVTYMAGKHVSALIIIRGKQPVGIFTVRDLIRCRITHPGCPFDAISVQEVMTNKLIIADAHERVSVALAMMFKAGVSHLPVVSDGAVVALLALRDLAQHHVHSLEAELTHLQDYMADFHEASRD